MASEVVLSSMIAEHVALVTLNRPEVMNAVNPDVSLALERAVRATEENAEVWVVILTGAGDKGFCTGVDLGYMARHGGKGIRTRAGGFAGFVNQSRSKPWIAAVNGYALAGGLEIVLACDLVVAAEHAKFGLPEVKRGLVAGAGGLYRLPRALPRALAFEAIVTGSPFAAQQAFAHGMVNRLVAREKLIEEALALAATICQNAPVAVRESLAVARQAYDLSDVELKDASGMASLRNSLTEDYKEGPRAFVEKRSPRWQGR
ncbi:MAG: enoyl-CoA hydratase/isomerase family protein [Burkholderiales bacterium]|nr:enoyl-CoA hydratase/isomerase family protein [Burkholderiales bacterium]